MKFSRFFVCIISCMFFMAIYAQNYVQEIEKITSKSFITQKDLSTIDSLLTLIKKEEGIDNDNFSKLAAIRISRIWGMQETERHQLYDDFLVIALDRDIPYDLLKKALANIVIEYLNDESKGPVSMNVAWQAELKHASAADTIDTTILNIFLGSLSREKNYGKADSILCSYIDFISAVYGKDNAIMEEALSLRSNNYDRWLLHSSDDIQANVYNNRLRNDKQLLSCVKNSSGENSFNYQNVLAHLAFKLCNAKIYNKGLSEDEVFSAKKSGVDLLKQWIYLKSDTLNIERNENSDALHQLYYNLYWVENDTVSGRKYAELYNDKFKEKYGEDSNEYFNALDDTRLYFSFDDQLMIIDKQIHIAQKIFGVNDDRYQELLQDKSQLLKQKGDLGGAIAAINLNEYQQSKNDVDRNFARLNSEYGNYKEARRLYKLAVKDDIEGKDPQTSSNMYSDISGLFNDYKKYNQTDSIFAYADKILSLIPDRPELQCNIIQCAAFTDPKKQAIEFIKSQLDKYPDLTKGDPYSTLLYCSGEVNARIGNYDTALESGGQAALFSNNIETQLKHSLFLEVVYLLKQDYLKAKEANASSQNILSSLSDDKEFYFDLLTLNYLSAYESLCLKEFSEAIASLNVCRQLATDISKMQPLIDPDRMWAAGSVYNVIRNRFILINNAGEFDLNIAPLMAEAKYLNGELEEAMQVVKPYLEDFYDLTRGMYVTEFTMSELKNIADETQDEFAKWSSRLDDQAINNMAYDIFLTAKQLTLTTSDNIKRIIGESGSAELKQKISELSELENKISELVINGLPVEDFLARKNALQTQIAIDVNQIGNIKDKLNTEWQTIQEALSDYDCAVEFSSFKNLNGDNTYAATLLTKNAAPETFTLFNESAFDINKVTYDPAYYDIVWKPIDERINGKGIRNIYFSPSGVLHLSGIEYIPVNGSESINNRYNLYRLSSTRELVHPKTIAHKDAAIFGGINYDNKPGNDKGNNPKQNRDLADIFDYLDENDRAGVNYLPGTRIEADTISEMLSKRIPVKLYVGDEGSETKIKNYSHRSPSILHIATHGFYWTKKDARRSSGLSFLAALNNDGIDQDDRDMSRSGILMSGANRTLEGRYSNVEDDGVLTAKEVSSIDLSGSDLVVLSACQSALGEVSGEGVFGLQRGLKIAGVNTILMTLWKVNDRATQMLMAEFYKNLLSGKSKLESLNLAQRVLREYEEEIEISDDENMTASQRRKSQRRNEETEPASVQKRKIRPFEDPKYWAAFVLLDALN